VTNSNDRIDKVLQDAADSGGCGHQRSPAADGGTARISARPEGGPAHHRAVPGHGRNLVATLTRTRSRPRGYPSVQFSTRLGTEFARL